MNISKNNKILIYRLGSLGDTVMALPCFHKIKNSFPDADITLLTNKPVMAKAAALEAILGTDYFFNRIINYPVGTRNLQILFGIIKQIRALKIDTVVNISPIRSKKALLRDRLFFKAAGISNLIGFDAQIENLTVCIDPETGINEWEAKRLARRISVLGRIDLDEESNWDLCLSDEEIAVADVYMDHAPAAPVLAISTGTKNQSNDWGIHNWEQLLTKLSGLLPEWKLVVIGAADEITVAEKCINAWGHDAINLCGKTTPRVSAALLKNASLFIGHDSGPIHLAAAVGAPCVGIYSARNMPGQWFPRGKNNQLLYNLPDCAGCGLEICIVQQKKCILSIKVDEVIQVVNTILNQQKISSPINKSSAYLPI
ncbi:ADP-heptose:LPS heptosyltransferase [Mucilaginibacter mallensis]|uniref:ADP-heptose:LPS heptosyltransferase n=1 Tax=Mucilaginibacter mallensis TaxID=652787 RepID=A0A1H1X9D7_MUCMA|nr:glycosyltransferase family 9 protein [Mucilaginibacter mallensis]SDT05943.1 ADP-heptose:LPS heptosyltransferase [Mucilaginibacter mallensis]